MALFFQLLSENEIKELTAEEIETLKTLFYHALYNDPVVKRQLGGKVAEALERIRAQKQTSNPNASAGA